MRDNISSLMDSEVQTGQVDNLIEQIGRDEEAREAWATYHLIGDVLRGDGVVLPSIQSRIFEKLADEPTVLAPKRRRQAPVAMIRSGIAVAASVATVSVVLWMANQDQARSPELARNTQIVSVSSPPPEPISAGGIQPVNLNEYLLAHEEFLPSTTAGYRRFASMNTVAPASDAAAQ